MLELTEKYHGLDFKYIFKEAKYDCSYMIVVFSGFGATGNFTYDMRNILKDVFAAVLWIKDDFFGNCCYYYSYNNKRIDPIVNNFILSKAEKYGFSKNNIIISGFSKGGSAALYYGIKYGYKSIISTVPQFNIALYNLKSHGDVLIHMLGDKYDRNDFLCLENLILDVVQKDDDLNKNIYLLTSQSDEQYDEQIEPYLKYLYKYTNLNIFLSESVLVRAHNQVTSHHVQLVLSWYYSLINGVAPICGIKALHGKKDVYREEDIDYNDYVIELKEFNSRGNVIYPQGVGLVRGITLKEWKDIDYSLILIEMNGGKVFEYNMAKENKPGLTRQYYNGRFCVYDKGWFCSAKHQGINLVGVGVGNYYIKLKIILNNKNRTIVDFMKITDEFDMVNSERFIIRRDDSLNVILEVK